MSPGPVPSSASSASTHRLTRLLTLVPYLLSHPETPVGELAELFGVPVAQVRKDLDLLWMCGLPGQAGGDLIDVSYSDDRVSLSNADTMARPLRLSTAEATALLVAVRALLDLPGLQEREALDRLLVKLEGAAGSAAGLADRLSVALSGDTAMLAQAREAVESGHRVRMTYHVPGRDEDTEREVDPRRVLVMDGRAYLEGWCHRAQGRRLFRLDRIVALVGTDIPAELDPQPGPEPAPSLFTPPEHPVEVVLDVAPAASWVAEYHPCEVLSQRADGGLRIRLLTGYDEWARRFVLGLGGDAVVVSPAQLADQVAQAARAALAGYGEPAQG